MYVAKGCEFSGLLENRRNRLCGRLCVRVPVRGRKYRFVKMFVFAYEMEDTRS